MLARRRATPASHPDDRAGHCGRHGSVGACLGAGSQMLQPLAIAVIGGILASMVLSLVVTPAVRYYLEAK